MSFESKKIIEFTAIGAQTKSFFSNLLQLFGMFCLGLILVFATLKGYSFFIHSDGFAKLP